MTPGKVHNESNVNVNALRMNFQGDDPTSIDFLVNAVIVMTQILPKIDAFLKRLLP